MDSPGERVLVGKPFQEASVPGSSLNREEERGHLGTQLGGSKPGFMLVYMWVGERDRLPR